MTTEQLQQDYADSLTKVYRSLDELEAILSRSGHYSQELANRLKGIVDEVEDLPEDVFPDPLFVPVSALDSVWGYSGYLLYGPDPEPDETLAIRLDEASCHEFDDGLGYVVERTDSDGKTYRALEDALAVDEVWSFVEYHEG